MMMARILAHPLLVHWYVENLDRGGASKRSPLPLGMVYPEGCAVPETVPEVPALAARPCRVFCAHRLREGPQWELRKTVSTLAAGPWRDFCTLPEGELPEADFMKALERHSFVLCVEGGGLDPSPKAWTALLRGAVPIIRRTAQSEVYAHLPVVFVEDWSETSLSPARLASWQQTLAPAFDTPEGRRKTLHRLSLEYWWDLVASGQPTNVPASGHW